MVSSSTYREFYEREKLKKLTPKLKKKREVVPNDSSSSDSEVDVTLDDEDFNITENEYCDSENLMFSLMEGNYVIVKYENKYYPGM